MASSSTSDSSLFLSSSSKSASSRGQKNSPPVRASSWKLSNLEEIGIEYEKNTCTLSEFMSRLKSAAKIKVMGYHIFPQICEALQDFSRELWIVSHDFQDESFTDADVCSRILEVEDLKEAFWKKESDMKIKFRDQVGDCIPHTKAGLLFNGWSWNMLEFWNYFVDLLARYKKAYQREGRFTFLFMAFSRMFFLRPEGGESYSVSVNIKDVIVHGIPDVRFTVRNIIRGEAEQKLFIVTEVKKYNAFRGEFTSETFCFENVSRNVLGQHGIELVMERPASFFFPGIVGIICIGTKVIFTYLEITNSHFDQINQGTIDKTQKAVVTYTRPYDYMNVDDRNTLMEVFFWLGYVQTDGYNVFGKTPP